MRGVQITLPERAKTKLDELTLQRDLELDASRSSNVRLTALPDDADPRMKERLASESSKHQQRFSVLSRVVSTVNQFLMETRVQLEMAPAFPIALKAGETPAAAIEAVRAGIAKVQQEIAQVRAAPMKRASQTEAINKYLARLAQQARPKVAFDVRGNATLRWAEDLVVSKDDLLGTIAAILGPEPIAAAFCRDLEPERADAVTPQGRQQRLDELAAQLLSLERREEELISRAEHDGTPVLRRPDASPLAVLGVAIVASVQAQVA
jgi:hypothetical protein